MKKIIVATTVLEIFLIGCQMPNHDNFTETTQQETENPKDTTEEDETSSETSTEGENTDSETDSETEDKAEETPEIDDTEYVPEDSLPEETAPDELSEWFVLEREYYVNQKLEDLYICFYDKEFVKAVYSRGSVKQNPFKPWKYEEVSANGKFVPYAELPEFCK